MRGVAIILGLAALLGMAPTVLAQGAGSPARTANDGKALFHEKCAMCHDANGAGTGLLARRMDPKIAELEKRTDLTPDFIAAAVRTGIGNMPFISRGEVSDPQLAAIAAYLSKGKAR